MGLRGKKPAIKHTVETPLTGTDVPALLGTEAATYWQHHAVGLIRSGLLTGATEHSFVVLCDLWQTYLEVRSGPKNKNYWDTVKAYQSLAKFFRLLPTEQPQEPKKLPGEQAEFEF